MICPKCKSEYREGFLVCADCGCDLVERLEVPDAQEVSIEMMQPVKIFDAPSQMEAELLKNTLEGLEIACYLKTEGADGYFSVRGNIAGIASFGISVFVDEADVEKAVQVVRELFGDGEENN